MIIAMRENYLAVERDASTISPIIDDQDFYSERNSGCE